MPNQVRRALRPGRQVEELRSDAEERVRQVEVSEGEQRVEFADGTGGPTAHELHPTHEGEVAFAGIPDGGATHREAQGERNLRRRIRPPCTATFVSEVDVSDPSQRRWRPPPIGSWCWRCPPRCPSAAAPAGGPG